MKTTKFGLIVLAICVAMIFVTVKASAQPYASMEAGTGLGINVGYSSGIVIQAGLNVPYTRRSDKPHIFYASLGYELGNEFTIIPSVGIANYGITELKVINKMALLTSIEAGRNFKTQSEHYGRYYVYVRNSVKVFAGVGLRIFVK